MENLEIKELCKEIINFYTQEQENECIPKEVQEKISNLRLQKILFFLYGYYWKENKKEITDISFEAWQYGPVNREVYYFEDYKYNEIDTEKVTNYEFNKKYNKESFEKILNHLGQFSTIRLVNASHQTDPWLKTHNSQIIDNKLIKKWFEEHVPEIKY